MGTTKYFYFFFEEFSSSTIQCLKADRHVVLWLLLASSFVSLIEVLTGSSVLFGVCVLSALISRIVTVYFAKASQGRHFFRMVTTPSNRYLCPIVQSYAQILKVEMLGERTRGKIVGRVVLKIKVGQKFGRFSCQPTYRYGLWGTACTEVFVSSTITNCTASALCSAQH